MKDLVKKADLVVAVGGGYLRGGTVGAAVKSLGAHFGQLRLAGLHGHKSIYMPQSIGPFRGLYKLAVTSQLKKVSTVYARDDRSVAEFASVPSVRRMPDMAVLELAATKPDANKAEHLWDKPIFIARELPRPRAYYSLLEAAAASNQFEWGLQSVGGGNDDYPLTRRLSGSEPRTMKTLLASPTSRIVVSTRLHGALSSLIAGFPAIHLSYERKGWGAFEDLGLGEYVLNARDATLDQVNALIATIRADPHTYWSTIEQNREDILQRDSELILTLKGTLDSSRRRSDVR